MTQLSGFMQEGFAAVRDALDDAVARANLHLRLETFTKAAAKRRVPLRRYGKSIQLRAP